jgi:carboxylesterase type B
MQSGTYAYTGVCGNPGYAAWGNLTAELNCTSSSEEEQFACVKAAPATAIKDAQERNGAIGFNHACDNVNVVSDPRTRLEAGNVADVPVLLGTNTAEGSFYTILYALDIDAYFADWFPGNETLKAAALEEYPLGTEGRDNEQYQMQQIHTDWSFHCVSPLSFSPHMSYIPLYHL